MNKLNIKIVSKDEFYQILLDKLVENYKEYSVKDILIDVVNHGFAKLDFENLGECLSKMFVYLPTMAVDIGDPNFVWVVSGNKAMVCSYKTKH